jgi:hypothetical protein
MPHSRPRDTFFQVITDAVAFFTAEGFQSETALLEWMARIRQAAERDMVPLSILDSELRRVLAKTYDRMVEKGGILVRHGDIPRFTLERAKPKLRAELDRRIMTSASQIKLNRVQSVEKTLQRFQGWATSIPAGGSQVVDKVPVKSDIRKALAQLPYEERRVSIDQGAKMVSAISNIIATDGGAIAVTWHDHGHNDRSYNARPEHMKRDGKTYAIKGNWAIEAGLMTKGPNGYYEDVTAFGEEVFCRCWGSYLYAIRRLPDSMLTQKGRDALQLNVAA